VSKGVSEEMREEILDLIKTLDQNTKIRAHELAIKKAKPKMCESYKLFSTIHIPKSRDILIDTFGDVLKAATVNRTKSMKS